MHAALVLAGLLLAVPAFALCRDVQRRTIVRAQRGPACAVVWDVGGSATPRPSGRQPWRLTCADGDPTCDADGASNGACEFTLATCLNVLQESCATAPVSRLRLLNPGKRILPALLEPPPPDPGCGTARSLKVPLRRGPSERLRPSKRLALALRARSTAGPIRNAVELECTQALAPYPCATRRAARGGRTRLRPPRKTIGAPPPGDAPPVRSTFADAGV
jgi:hypothetical protein